MTTTEVTVTTYIAYMFPGAIIAEESVTQVTERNPQKHADEAPKAAFAFYYFDVVSSVVDVNGERIALTSDRRSVGETYYIDAQLLSYNAVAALPGDYDSLLHNMRGNNWGFVVRCRTGNFRPLLSEGQEFVSTVK